MSRLLLGALAILGLVATGLAQDGVAPWPLERQDRWGTGRATVGPPASEMTTPWVDKRIITSALVSHGASLGPDGIGYFGNWQGHLVYKIDFSGNILGAFDAVHHVRSTPAIGMDGQVFASTGEEGFPPGRVFAIDTTIMDYNWFKDVGWMGGSPTLGPDGDVVVATGSGKAIRWDNTTGATIWERSGLGPARATVVFSRDDQLVFVAHGSKISAFTYAHGRPTWTVDLGAPAASPGVAPDGTVVVGADSGLVYALDPTDGETKWTWQTLNGVRGAPAFSDNGLAYVGSKDHRLYALRVSDGVREWSFTSTGPITNPPVVDALGRIYFHNQAKDIFCILPTGHEEWRAHMAALSRGVMTIGPDNTLYVGCSDGLDGLAIIRQHALPLAPTGLSIDRGVVLGGGLPEILESDDDYLRIRPGITLVSSQSPIQFVTTMLSPRTQLASLKLFVESASTSTSVRQQIEAFSFSTNSYEVISAQPTTLADNVLEVNIIVNPTRFVQSGSGLMRFRFSYKATGPVLSFPYTVRVDQIRSTVVPAFVP